MDINSLSFDSINTADYGIYISGRAAYNAPARVYEMQEIPGRNGRLALDMGRYENVAVTYPAFIFDQEKAGFSSRMSNIRNQFLSKVGYKKLTDTYNPDEYRLAVFKRGFEVDSTQFNRTGTFDLTFDCKPQRFLLAGETPVPVSSGDSIVNPTVFPSSPLLMLDGYGNIRLGDNEITIIAHDIGTVDLISPINQDTSNSSDVTKAYHEVAFNEGDMVTINQSYMDKIMINNARTITNAVVSTASFSSCTVSFSQKTVTISATPNSITYEMGGAHNNTYSANIRVIWTDLSGNNKTTSLSLTYRLAYGTNDSITSYDTTYEATGASGAQIARTRSARHVNATITSTVLVNYENVYVDLENGSAWRNENGVVISLNSSVWLGADLPRLEVGSNTITYDNTITSLAIIPRWWRL